MAYTTAIAKNGVSGDDESRRVKYIVFGDGSLSSSSVESQLNTDVPATLDGIPLQKLSFVQVSDNPEIWTAEASYAFSNSSNGSSAQPPEAGIGNREYSFDISTSSVNVKRAIATIASYGTSPPNFQGAINVSSDGTVEGVDILSPASSFSFTITEDRTFFSDAYIRSVEAIVGTVNSTTFAGRAAGEVLFAGLSGRVVNTGESTITYAFLRSPNKTGISVGSLTGIAKKGWEYLWVRFEKSQNGTSIVQTPKYAYTVQVYDTSDFASVLGFGA